MKDFDFNVYVIDPKHIKRSIGLVRGKNDKVDAKRIAIFIERNYHDFECWKPCSEAIRSLKILMSQRKSKIKQRKRIKQQMADLKDITFNSSTQKLIKINQKAIKELDRHIHEIETLIRAEINRTRFYNNSSKGSRPYRAYTMLPLGWSPLKPKPSNVWPIQES